MPAPEQELQTERLPLHELHQDPSNPKTHTKRNYDAIAASLRDHGQVAPLIVQRSTRIIIAGNATALSMAGEGMTHADVVLLDVDDAERKRLAVRLNRTSELGAWDTEVLKTALEGWGSEYDDLWTGDEAAKLFDDALDGAYNRKVVAPVYEPKGQRPKVADLFDDAKTAELVEAIEAAELPDELAHFLKLAAERHTRFNFQHIAEFYCHVTPEVQRLMEQSGLVIIDFDAAIEHGFVKLTKRLGDLADAENRAKADA